LTVAHELACRGGFEVIVHEPRSELGGKARSQFSSGLPGEHGFRFFPGWYLHVTDIMRRIPLPGTAADRQRSLSGYPEPESVVSKLREVRQTLTFRAGKAPEAFLQIPEGIADLPEFLQGFSWVTEGLSVSEQLHTLKRVGLKFLLFFSTPPWLRAGRFDGQTLAQFLDASSLPAPVLSSLKTVPKALVAMDAFEGSAFTFLNTSLLNLAPAWDPSLPKDRVLRGPTSHTWIEPWVTSLKALGVEFVQGDAGRAERVHVENGRVTGITSGSGERLTADAYVLAMPVGPLQELVKSSGLADAGADFDALSRVDLRTQTSEMVGIQLYTSVPFQTQPGHLFFPDSQYGLTAISQLEIWDEEHILPLRARGVHGVLSIDITQWRTDPFGKTPPAFPLPIAASTSQELCDLVVRQLGVYQLQSGAPLLHPEHVLHHHVDDDIDLATEVNRSELLVHPPGTWARRPLAQSSLPGLYFGSDFAKNPADLATMEGACSAGKLAARAVLERHAPSAPPIIVHELVQELEPPWLEAQQRGFEALVQLVGGFERACRLLDLLFDTEDGPLEVLRALAATPDSVTEWLGRGGRFLQSRSLFGRLGQRLWALGTWFGQKLGLFDTEPKRGAEPDPARVVRKLHEISEALQAWR
ncbi:MAG TPA: FAD-dependent oxidoreductase, partial [Polyangiaceae bacterium]|nr:FAD-dependent oxidoreductase [Polyangiaceae bacterium]